MISKISNLCHNIITTPQILLFPIITILSKFSFMLHGNFTIHKASVILIISKINPRREFLMNLLHPDNPLMRFLSRLFDLIILNLLFIFSCIPVITIGAALSAIYQVLFKIIDKKDPYIFKGYIKAFKENFKQATLLWIFVVLIGISISFATSAINVTADQGYEFLQIPVWVLVFIISAVAVYAFPLLSRYQCGIVQLLKNAFVLSITNIPVTVIIIVFPLGLLYFASTVSLNVAAIYCIIFTIGCSGTLYLVSYVLFQIFKKFENE